MRDKKKAGRGRCGEWYIWAFGMDEYDTNDHELDTAGAGVVWTRQWSQWRVPPLPVGRPFRRPSRVSPDPRLSRRDDDGRREGAVVSALIRDGTNTIVAEFIAVHTVRDLTRTLWSSKESCPISYLSLPPWSLRSRKRLVLRDQLRIRLVARGQVELGLQVGCVNLEWIRRLDLALDQCTRRSLWRKQCFGASKDET